MVGSLARFFRGINIAMGVTTLPDNATPAQERKFVLIWLGIVGFFFAWLILLFFWITN